MKQFVFIFCVSVLLFSCKKEYSYEGGPTSNPTYYLTATVDGVPLTFNVDNEALYTISSGTSVLELVGFASADQTNNTNITLDIHYDETTVLPPGVGTYSEHTDDYYVTGLYDFNSDDSVYTAGEGSFISVRPLTVTITSIKNNIVEGTFSGAFYRTDTDDNEVHSDYILITEGKFKLPLQ